MARVLILVEGQTEEVFVRDVLAPHLAVCGVHLQPTIVATKAVRSGGRFKGGLTRYDRVASDVRRLLGDRGAALVTTMFDFYGLPGDFPGCSTLPAGDCFARVAHLERAFQDDIGDARFLPHLALHEFEAIVFVEPRSADWVFSDEVAVAELERIRDAFASPEEINEGRETAPSKRIRRLFPRYQKPLFGAMIAASIGLERIRARCRHLDGWVSMLERLGA